MHSLRSLLACVGAAMLLATAAASGQSLLAPDASTVERIASLARANLSRARVADGSFVPPETLQERARPIIPDRLVRQSVERGFVTGQMQACAMDWDRGSFRPYMAKVRAVRKYDDKQLAYIALLHGISQGLASTARAKRAAPCSEAERRLLTQAVGEAPVQTP